MRSITIIKIIIIITIIGLLGLGWTAKSSPSQPAIHGLGRQKIDWDKYEFGDDTDDVVPMHAGNDINDRYDDRIWMGNRDNLELPLVEFKGIGV